MGNILRISWTELARLQLESIFNWLNATFGERAAISFILEVKKTQKIISEYPYAFKASITNPRNRLASVHAHVALVYEVRNEEIVILTLLDYRAGGSSE